tara:strand:+ start:2028 stop:2726 length:699 start_codon:yes stop_codon:yes gene_type:complete
MSSTSPSFIGEYYIDEKFCDKLVDFFHTVPDQDDRNDPRWWYVKTAGQIGIDTANIRPEAKDSIDLTFGNRLLYSDDLPVDSLPYSDILHEYFRHMRPCVEAYIKEYPHSSETVFQVKEGVNLQYYAPGQGYHMLHCERSGPYEPSIYRHLVFMTYLNTVTDKGGTHFHYQNYTANAVKGKTLIWPCDWTHMHKGISSPTQDKYIMTGWYSHTDPNGIWADNQQEVQLMLDL